MAKNIITEEIVNALNKELVKKGCGFEYILADNGSYSPTIRRVVVDRNGFVDSCIINCTKAFYEWFENWFKNNYNIELTYNNTGEICWATECATDED